MHFRRTSRLIMGQEDVARGPGDYLGPARTFWVQWGHIQREMHRIYPLVRESHKCR